MNARLLTKGGDFVADIEVPFFVTPPNVIVWGQRFFLPFDQADGESGVLYCAEGFAWFHAEEVKHEHTGEGGEGGARG